MTERASSNVTEQASEVLSSEEGPGYEYVTNCFC
jgi:hypothetical protein